MEIPALNDVSTKAAAAQPRVTDEANNEFAKLSEQHRIKLLLSQRETSKSENTTKTMSDVTKTMGEISDKLSQASQ